MGFFFAFASALIGIRLSRILPAHHLSDESTSAIEWSNGLVATITALVLGLLIASAKASFDTINRAMREAYARVGGRKGIASSAS